MDFESEEPVTTINYKYHIITARCTCGNYLGMYQKDVETEVLKEMENLNDEIFLDPELRSKKISEFQIKARALRRVLNRRYTRQCCRNNYQNSTSYVISDITAEGHVETIETHTGKAYRNKRFLPNPDSDMQPVGYGFAIRNITFNQNEYSRKLDEITGIDNQEEKDGRIIVSASSAFFSEIVPTLIKEFPPVVPSRFPVKLFA